MEVIKEDIRTYAVCMVRVRERWRGNIRIADPTGDGIKAKIKKENKLKSMKTNTPVKTVEQTMFSQTFRLQCFNTFLTCVTTVIFCSNRLKGIDV